MTSIAKYLYPFIEQRRAVTGFRMQLEVGGYRELTWPDYLEQSKKVAQFLRNKKIDARDRILLVSENCPEWSIVFLAANSIGATLVPVSALATAKEIMNVSQRAQPKFAFLSNTIANNNDLKIDVPYTTWNPQTEDPLAKIIKNIDPLEKLPEDDFSDSDAFVIYTSGTTGKPKAVPLTNANVLANLQGTRNIIQADESDSLVSVLPLSHMFEMMAGFLTPVLLGANITYVKSIRPEDILRALKDVQATVMVAVPLLFEVMSRTMKEKIQHLPPPMRWYYNSLTPLVKAYPFIGRYIFFLIHRAFGGRLKYFVAGGARLLPEVYEFFDGLGIKILQGYGLTETAPVLSCSTVDNSGADHVGNPLKGVELGVFSAEGVRRSEGEEGEIWARGANVFRGYLDEEHNVEVFSDDWFRTGDLGIIDEKGNVRVTGRKKDIIVTPGGKNIYPEEIEHVLLKSEKFLEVAVLATEKKPGKEIVTAVIVPDPKLYHYLQNKDLDRAVQRDVIKACRDLSDYKQPQRIEVWRKELPKTLTRKIKKFEIKKALESAEKPKPDTATEYVDKLDLDDPLEKEIAVRIASITGKPEAFISKSDSLLSGLSIDSITFVELISGIERKLSKTFDIPEFANVDTVEDLLLAIRPQMHASRSSHRKAGEALFSDFSPVSFSQQVFKIPFFLLNLLLRGFMFLFYPMEWVNREVLDQEGPFIITPNHSSHFDTIALFSCIPISKITNTHAVAAKDYFFNTTPRSIFSRIVLNAIPFDRKRRVDQSMSKCLEALNAGHSLIIFPEGTRSADGKIQEFKPGVAHLIKNCKKAKTIPVYIEGTYKILPKGKVTPRLFSKIKISFSDPVKFDDVEDSRDGYKEIADRLRDDVLALNQPRV